MSIKVAKNDFIKKLKILTHLQKLPKNVGDLGKLIAATGFEKLAKVHVIAQSGHTCLVTRERESVGEWCRSPD